MTQIRTTIPKRTIGIDLGDRDSAYCVLNAAGETIEQDSVQNDQVSIEGRFGAQLQARIIIEASCQSHAERAKPVGRDPYQAGQLRSAPNAK